ncbi:MAG: MerR family transcriptional regulator [Nocardia sp.]|nr:MerR family transcriptional regulator [Nocardia sp.]
MLIGEVAQRSGVSTRMLRHYDTLGLVRPTGRTVGGYREYTTEDIRRIFHVESLRSLGLSLRQVGHALRDPAVAPAELVGDLIRRTEDRLRRERELLDRLRTVDAAEPTGWQDVLRMVELLHGLGSPNAARRQQTALTSAEDTPIATDVLAGAVLTESDPNVAGALRWALARAGADGVTRVAAGLSSEDAEIRRRAVLALTEIPGDEANAILVRALGSADATVRRYAALAVGGQGDPVAVPVLVEMVIEGTQDVEAAEVLGALARNPEQADRISSALTAALTADTVVRIRVAQAFAEMPRAVAAAGLRPLAEDPDPAVALVAAAFTGMLDAGSDD